MALEQVSHSSSARAQALIVVHPDNYIEVFAQKTVDIRIVHMPVAYDQEGECLAEDYVEQQLPMRWRELYFPGMLRAATNVRPLNPSIIAEAEFVSDLIKKLNQLADINKDAEERRHVWIL